MQFWGNGTFIPLRCSLKGTYLRFPAPSGASFGRGLVSLPRLTGVFRLHGSRPYTVISQQAGQPAGQRLGFAFCPRAIKRVASSYKLPASSEQAPSFLRQNHYRVNLERQVVVTHQSYGALGGQGLSGPDVPILWLAQKDALRQFKPSLLIPKALSLFVEV